MSTSLDLEGLEFCQNGKNMETNKDIIGWERVYDKAQAAQSRHRFSSFIPAPLPHTFIMNSSVFEFCHPPLHPNPPLFKDFKNSDWPE